MMFFCKAVAWALAILATAWASRSGLISDSSATTMFAILPALAVISLRGGNCMSSRHSRHAG